MAEHLGQLDVTLMAGVGAAFDFHCRTAAAGAALDAAVRLGMAVPAGLRTAPAVEALLEEQSVRF